ncbi:MAG: hypothetical protein ACFE8N_00130 [Promethearchaeota archaeon]
MPPAKQTQKSVKNTIGGGGRNQSVKFTLPKDKNPGCKAGGIVF